MAAKVMTSDAVLTVWHNLLDDVLDGDDIVVARDNKAITALISYEDYLALHDEIEDLRSGRRAQAELEAWRKDPSLSRP